MVLNSLGGVLRDLGLLAEARGVFERSLEIGEKLQDRRHIAMVLNSLGGLLRDLELLAEARAAFERCLAIRQALKDQRGEAMVLNSLGGVLRDLALLSEARETFERSLAIGGAQQNQRHQAMVLNSLGGVLRDLGLLSEAREAFERSLSIGEVQQDQRHLAIVLHSLGGVLRDLGLLSEAREAFERSLSIGEALQDQRQIAMVLNSLGWLYRELGNPSKALEILEESRAKKRRFKIHEPTFLPSELNKLRQWSGQALAETGNLAAYHRAMTKIRAAAEDWHGAAIHMRRNLELDPSGPQLNERTELLAYNLFRAHQRDKAIEVYRSALSQGALSPRGHASLGRALHLVGGDRKAAETHLRKACELQPENAWAWSWLGLLLADQDRLEEAEILARRAVAQHNQHAVLLYNLAQVLARHPNDRQDKLRKALDVCAQASASADRPFDSPGPLARDLELRLSNSDSETTILPSRDLPAAPASDRRRS